MRKGLIEGFVDWGRGVSRRGERGSERGDMISDVGTGG